jgi:lipopolysaccharide export system permease protein
MFTLIDRQLTYAFVKAYIFCLVSLLGMYIVIDLFMNLDDFTRDGSFADTVNYILTYYGYKTTQIFDRLSEAIALLAAMFTVAWMQRNNELLPLLSAGVSTRRVVRPVLLAACATLGLSVLNQELVLPNIDNYLVDHRGDREGNRETQVKGAFESNGIHLSGKAAYKKDLLVKDFTVVIPQKQGEGIVHLQAKEARYLPPVENQDHEIQKHTGGWMLTQTTPPELDAKLKLEGLGLDFIVAGQYFLATKHVDFDILTRSKYWYSYLPTYLLAQYLGSVDTTQVASVAVVFHMRLTRPLLGAILVFMGLSVILRDQNRNVFISAGLCLALCGVFFGAQFACKFLGDYEHIGPALAAWIPVIGFGPLTFVMFDAVHT